MESIGQVVERVMQAPAQEPEESGCWCNGRGGERAYFDGRGRFVHFARYCKCEAGKKCQSEHAEMRLRMRQERIEELWRCSGIWQRDCDATLEQSPLCDRLTAIESSQSVYLCGPTGTGKTFTAIGYARHWLAQNAKPVRFVRESDLMKRVQATYADNSTSESEDDVTGPLRTCGLLVLDDLGTAQARSHEWWQTILDSVLGVRHDQCLPTVITSNLSPLSSHAREFLGPRLQSRILGTYAVIEVAGQDRRLEGRQ